MRRRYPKGRNQMQDVKEELGIQIKRTNDCYISTRLSLTTGFVCFSMIFMMTNGVVIVK